jgi:hypothetical protein
MSSFVGFDRAAPVDGRAEDLVKLSKSISLV